MISGEAIIIHPPPTQTVNTFYIIYASGYDQLYQQCYEMCSMNCNSVTKYNKTLCTEM